MLTNDSISRISEIMQSSSSDSEREKETGNKRQRKPCRSGKKKLKLDDKTWKTANVKEKMVLKRERSSRTPKPKKLFDEEDTPLPQYRTCSARGCLDPQPRCCLQASSNCTRDGYTSRWYHMSLGEHFCNDCFDHFYRINKAGSQEFQDWSQMWYKISNIKPAIKLFVSECVLPYWLRCTISECGKWREYAMDTDPTPEFIRNFKCQTAYKRIQKNHCNIPEESCVSDISKPDWLSQVTEVALLKRSAASPYLKMYYPEGIGHSPSPSYPTIIKPPKYIEPFKEMFNGHSTIWIRPNIVDDDEEKYMPSSLLYQPMFFAVRNLAVTLWNCFPCEWLTVDKISEYLVCRGLIRIYMLKCVEKILTYLTRKGVINYGLVNPPDNYSLLSIPKENIVIVGAGIAGLAIAKHLKNHGITFTILEAKSRIGGRIWDSENFSHGANIIKGLTNNPLTILCHQSQIPINEISSEIVFVSENGAIISEDINEHMNYQYSGIMHGALEWAKENRQDANWYDIIIKNQKEYDDQIRSFSAEENDVFNCLLQLNELEKGEPNRRLTLLSYEEPKSEGLDGEISVGFSNIISKLAADLNINLNNEVNSIQFVDNHINIKTNKDTFIASKVILTVPLYVLKNQIISFDPPLPENKIKCINELEYFYYEKILLQFPNKFWSSLLKNGNKRFAIVSKEPVPFQLFYDITNSDNVPTLQTVISESHFDIIKNKNDEELKEICLNILRKVFCNLEVKVPEPSNYFVTRWYLDPYIKSSGSFIKVDSSYSLYDTLSEDIDKKLYFAGEATFRKCPNSTTGAYLSGLREAVKILDEISPLVNS